MYSQNDEEKYIVDYFKGRYNDIVVLDIGANDGKTLSNSLRLIELGASAHLIEASPTVFKLLEQRHKDNLKVKCYNYGMGSKVETLKFYESGELLGKGDSSLVSTFKESEKKRWEKLNMAWTEHDLRVVTFTQFLWDSREPDFHYKFNFITIDIEGLDYDVLKQINLNGHGVEMICVEWNSLPDEKKRMTEYIESFGLKLIMENAENLIFAK